MKRVVLSALLCGFSCCAFAQGGTLSGDLMTNVNFYQKDDIIGANTDLYTRQLSGGESWLSLRYNYKGFTATLRADAFHNSNLYDPNTAMTAYGIGAWSLSKEWDKLSVTAGYIYDQVGSGILFRSYEDRGLLIDNALVGLMLRYKLTDNIMIKGFSGQQKDIYNFDKADLGRYKPVIKGLNAEGDFDLSSKVHITPGVGAINRTLDQTSVDVIAADVNSLPVDARFEPMYNMYAFTAYNTLTVGDFSWYAEGAYKTHEAIRMNDGTLEDHSGNVEYTTLGFARKGIAINVSGKRTENFSMSVSPTITTVNRGILNWQPIIARIRPQRLMARYAPPSQNLSEQTLGADVLASPSDDLSMTFNYTYINTLDNIELYREAYGDAEYRGLDNWILLGGVQYLHYNQELYQEKAHAPLVKAVTPFLEATYKLNSRQSLHAELEYMYTKQDYGSWAFALLEYDIAPKWSVALSDMYITDLNPDNPYGLDKPVHYYNAFVAFTKGPHRITASYVKQPAGINCTGGVCRYEPAFSGLRFGLTSSF